MLTLAIIFIVISSLLLALGLRGRVAARGRFCGACGFDLQGIELPPEGAPCPECGRPVGPKRTISPIRREKRRGIIVIAAVLFLVGAGLTTVHLTGNTASMFAVMPDRVVLAASERGFDEAIDELIARISASEQPPAWVWDGAVRAALEHQLDTDQEWNPRWGEVISLAIQNSKLSVDQLAAFARNGSGMKMWLRERIRAGDSYVSYWCTHSMSRTPALTRFDTGYMLRIGSSSDGVVFEGEEFTNQHASGGMMGTSFIIPRAGSFGSSATGSGVMIPKEIRDRLEPGDTFELWMDVQITLTSRTNDTTIEAEPIRFTQTVTVVGEDEPIVRVVSDPPAAKRARENMSIEPIVLRDVDLTGASSRREFANTSVQFTAKPKSIAGTLYFRHHTTGELFEAASFSTPAKPVDTTQTPIPQLRHSHQITIQIDTDDRERIEAFERVTSDGVVDIVFRTDPSVAESNARISEVVDLELMFVGVPVYEEGDERLQSMPGSDENKTPASAYVED
ncbi:MAG: zinc ribbon domain-containing protein [bacterium]|nr:zinc ribbon domain-containing protein [bacterium]